jgi:hypothetical protein
VDSVLDAALTYASNGLRIIPIAPGEKFPKGIQEWQTVATTNPDTIRTWYSGPYRGWGIGIATGLTARGQHLFVLDVDDRANIHGTDTLRDLEASHAPLPATRTVITGSGGAHYYFLSPVEIHNDAGKRLGQGLDIRGVGGQVLAPPTLHPVTKRAYEWDAARHPIATAPDWLVQLLTFKPERFDQHRTPVPADELLAGGDQPSDRYNASTTWDRLLRHDGWTFAREHNGIQYWTRPDKDPRHGISASVGHGGGDHMVVFTTAIPWLPPGGYSRFGYYAAKEHGGNWRDASRHYLRIQDHPPVPQTNDELAGFFIDWHELFSAEHKTEHWIAKPLIAYGRQTALFASAKSGKSWLTLSTVAALATGTPILGAPPQPAQHVLYLDYEMTQEDLVERMNALGYDINTDLSHLHYAQIPSLPPLNTKEGADTVVKMIEYTKATVLIIDTTGRALEGEENSADPYKDFARFTGLAMKKLGVAVLRTDHAGKDKKKGQRGSSAKNDDVDLVYRVDAIDGGFRLVRTHSRINWAPAEVTIKQTKDNDTDVYTLTCEQAPARAIMLNPEQVELYRKLLEMRLPPDLTQSDMHAALTQKGAQKPSSKLWRAAYELYSRELLERSTHQPPPPTVAEPTTPSEPEPFFSPSSPSSSPVLN